MTAKGRAVTIIIVKEGELNSRSIRIPLWLLRAGVIAGTTLSALVVLAAVLYAPIARRAARVPPLTREVERLSAENQRVQQLAASLEEAEARYGQLRTMLGGDVVPELARSEGSLPTAVDLFARLPNATSCYEGGPSPPRHWPLDQSGVITRGPVGAGSSDEVHTGIDIAVAKGTPIRAAGGGTVVRAGDDPEYGLFVEMDHPDGYASMYGHASRLFVAQGDTVNAGQVIGMSGSTGRSTAPHLHFEILQGGRSIDPGSLVSQRCANGHSPVRGG